MQFHTILAFAIMFWRAEAPFDWSLFSSGNVPGTLTVSIGQPVFLALAAGWCIRKTRRKLLDVSLSPDHAHRFHQRSLSALRLLLILGFAVSVLLTDWPRWFAFGRVAPSLQIFGDLIVLTPYLAGCMALWLLTFSVEGALRCPDHASDVSSFSLPSESWRLGTYLDFHFRHHFLVIAAPMLLILFASNMIRGYETALRQTTGWFWMPDALLGLVATCVFVMAPVLLCKLWRTAPLGPGPLRERLEALCRRIKLRCRGIRVWQSDGLMINAAVMGILPAARYVLLSDALLSAMSPRQVEAVFGHEAGHVRHRHIQHFLVFAFVGWLTAGAVMELVGLLFDARWGWSGISVSAFQGIGLAATFSFWMIGFGWLSRRFERQADLFGARCVTPDAADCHLPCSVHLKGPSTSTESERVCATAAEVFASALDRVAIYSGIPHEERSWRHSSVGNRVLFLHSVAGDPALAVRFEHLVRRVKKILVAVAVLGAIGGAFYFSESLSPVPTQTPGVSVAP